MFEYEDIAIRPVEKNDLDFIKEIRNHPSTWNYLTTVGMFNSRNQEKWFAKITDSPDVEYYIITNQDGDRIGYIRFDEIDQTNKCIRVGSDIHMKYRRQGQGTKTLRLILEYCFNFRNFNRVWLLVVENNRVALGLYQKLGFKKEGRMREAIYRNGTYHDYVMMSILQREYKK